MWTNKPQRQWQGWDKSTSGSRAGRIKPEIAVHLAFRPLHIHVFGDEALKYEEPGAMAKLSILIGRVEYDRGTPRDRCEIAVRQVVDDVAVKRILNQVSCSYSSPFIRPLWFFEAPHRLVTVMYANFLNIIMVRRTMQAMPWGVTNRITNLQGNLKGFFTLDSGGRLRDRRWGSNPKLFVYLHTNDHEKTVNFFHRPKLQKHHCERSTCWRWC